MLKERIFITKKFVKVHVLNTLEEWRKDYLLLSNLQCTIE